MPGEIITYKNQPNGVFAQIRFETNERILISLTQSSVKIFKLRLFGNFPTKTLWELPIVHAVELFDDLLRPHGQKNLLDVMVEIATTCKSVKEVLEKIPPD